jgi:hypothetical protein
MWCHIIDYNFKNLLTFHGSLLCSPLPTNGPSLEQDEIIHILIQYSEIHVILFSHVSCLHRLSEIQIFMICLHLPCMLHACLAHCPLIAQNIRRRVKIMIPIKQFYPASHHSLCQVKTFDLNSLLKG